MRLEMHLHLPLRLDDESEADAVPEAPCHKSEAERTRIPEGIEQRRARTELVEARLGPREMVGLLACRVLEMLAQCVIPGGGRLCRVERLRADFAHMIHAHQTRGLAPLLWSEDCVVAGDNGASTGRSRAREEGAEGAVGRSQQSVHAGSLRALRTRSGLTRP